MLIDFSSLLGNLSYLLYVLAFAMRNMLALRILAILSSLCALFYFFFLDVHPVWIGVFWEVVFISVNVVQISILAYEHSTIDFTREERLIYDKIFHKLSVVEYKKIVKISKFVGYNEGEILINKGEIVQHLILICDGLVGIFVNDQLISSCRGYSFIGEMSFLSGEPAVATVKTVLPTRCMVWLQKDLLKLLDANPQIHYKIQSIFNTDLLNKLKTSVSEAEHNIEASHQS